MQIFELVGNHLYVPDFEYLLGELLYASATEGIKNPKVRAYVEVRSRRSEVGSTLL
ncbi:MULTISPECIES: hypothetical protein [unclassified Nostoc]|uniref:hypothetical protein n=1 Tax=unclassified Nostoc TaxID=2593658 RepID=UPI002AD43D90|nr:MULTISPECIES: hypothetical protein [unclassified Nostoc]MDZ8122116.1 hypothetical protein [Nostoc sp. CmiVER01]MDZ8227623.1 hypothetical protein [Nostoc sp. ChiVER01]